MLSTFSKRIKRPFTKAVRTQSLLCTVNAHTFSNMNPVFNHVMDIKESDVIISSKYHIDIREDYTGVTQTLHLSFARMDRLPFHLSRWHDNMSIALQLFEHELPQALDYVMKYARNNIRWSFYIIDDAPTNKCFYIRKNGTRLFHDSCYECNILRNLAIESITTSHFLIIDGDGIMTRIPLDNR